MLILLCSFFCGFIGFWLGFNGPLTPDGNLGPIMGIFITGPTGTLIGAVIGLIHSAYSAKGRSIRAELCGLGFIFILSLLYLLCIFQSFEEHLSILPIGLQAVVIISVGFLLGSKRVIGCSTEMRKCHQVVLIAGTLIILASIFPPVSRPWWDPEQTWKRHSVTEKLPIFAYFLDSRFAASKHVPEFAINRSRLILEWLTIIAIAGAVSYSIVKRQSDEIKK